MSQENVETVLDAEWAEQAVTLRNMLSSVNESGIGHWGLLAIVALVASPVSLMIGDPVHSVRIVGVAAILLGLLAFRTAAWR
jgi:hypothetical protein